MTESENPDSVESADDLQVDGEGADLDGDDAVHKPDDEDGEEGEDDG